MKYYKEINGKLVEPPKNLRKPDGSYIINYNLNEEQLIKDGYLQYTDTQVQVINNEEETLNVQNMTFSKLKVKEKLVEIGIWETLKESLTENEYEDLLLAKDLAFDNPTFIKFYIQLKDQIENIDDILMTCI